MIYVATRENLGRKLKLERAEAALADGGKLWRLGAGLRHAGIRPLRDRAGGRAIIPLQHQPRRYSSR